MAWDNEIDFHVSRNLLLLRKFREESQTGIASAAGTSQPKVARIESGNENITLRTLKRMVVALKGRFRVSIAPAEFTVPHCPDWWEWLSVDGAHGKWAVHGVIVVDDGNNKKAGMAWTAPSDIPALTESSQSGTMTLTLTSGTE